MGLVETIRGKARTLSAELRRADMLATDKAVFVAQRSLAAAGLGDHFSVGRHDIFTLAEPPAPIRDAPEVTIRTAGTADLDGVCAVDETPPALVDERLRRGDLVYVGLIDRRVVCHAWFHRGPRPFTEDEPILARWALAPTTFWSYGGAAAPDARRSGVYAKVFQTGLADLFSWHGALDVQCRADRADKMSCLLLERLGFERLGTLTGFATPWVRSLVWLGPPAKRFVFGPNSSKALPLPP